MDSLNKSLDRIETHLRSLIEEHLTNLFVNTHPHHSLITQLIGAMRENIQQRADGRSFAPDHFIIQVPPEDLSEWQINQEILDRIAAELNEIGNLEDLVFQQIPRIELHVKPELGKNHFDLTAKFSTVKPALKDTATMAPPENNNFQSEIPKNAVLIIGGTTNYSLDKPVINIGRHSNNDLVLSDLHVSRHHAQLRAINKNFIIFDVGSTGGLLLNGKAITQASLQSGDVIRIGLVNLIYIQDITTANPTTVIPIDSDNDTPGEHSG
jgi:hypothetical protein